MEKWKIRLKWITLKPLIFSHPLSLRVLFLRTLQIHKFVQQTFLHTSKTQVFVRRRLLLKVRNILLMGWNQKRQRLVEVKKLIYIVLKFNGARKLLGLR